jgi:hypothetical protein
MKQNSRNFSYPGTDRAPDRSRPPGQAWKKDKEVFLNPVDGESNHERVFVVMSAIDNLTIRVT